MHHSPIWLAIAHLLYGLLIHTAPVTSFGNPGAMLHRAASSGHSRDDSFGTVGMCCHGPAVFCSFLNHLVETCGDGRWRKHAQATKSTKNSGSGLSQSFPTLF